MAEMSSSQEVSKRFLVNPSPAAWGVFQERYNLAMTSHCLRREDEVSESGLYDILDTPFMMDNFLLLMGIPRHMLMTTLEGYTDTVYCLEYRNGRVYSGSGDGTIRVW
jgi:hypothetical protein